MRGLRVAVLIAVAALCGCAARTPSPPADGGRWIALPREAPSGQLVAWVRGPWIFVMRSQDVLTALDDVHGDAEEHAAIRNAVVSYRPNAESDVLFLNAVIGDSPHLYSAFGPVLADLLAGRRASLLDTERGFVVRSVQEVPISTRAARYRSFQTRDGREVLRVADQHWQRGIAL